MTGAVARRHLFTIGAGYLAGALFYTKLPGPDLVAMPNSIFVDAARPLLASPGAARF